MRLTVPSERNLKIYHAVETLRQSRRDVAGKFGISSTRVQQIVTDVKAFVQDHGSAELLGIEPERLELVSLRMCFERLSYFSNLLVSDFVALELAGGNVSARIRLMQACARCKIEQTKIAARIAKTQLAMKEAGTLPEEPYEFVREEDESLLDEHEATEPPAIPDLPDPATTLPPVGGCTTDDDSEAAQDRQFIRDLIASNDPAMTSDELFQAILTRTGVKVPQETPAQSRRERRRKRRRK